MAKSDPSKPSKRLSTRIVVALALAIIVTMSLMIGVSVKLERDLIDSGFEERNAITTQLLGSTLAGSVKFKKADKIEEGFVGFLEQVGEDVLWIAAIDVTGEVIFESGTSARSDALIANFMAQTESEEPLVIGDGASAERIRFGKDNALVGGLIVEWSKERVIAASREHALIVALLGILVAGAGLVACAWWLNSLVIRPLRAMDESMSSLSEGGFDIEVPGRERVDEIGRMAHRLDGFRVSLKRAEEAKVEKERASAELAQARQAMLAELDENIGSVVAAAKVGAFDKRVADNMEDETFSRIGKGVNDICDNVSNFSW